MVEALRQAQERPEQVVVLFEDEATFYRQPTQAPLWASRGRRQPRVAYSHRSNTRLRMVASLNARTGAVYSQDMSTVTVSRLARYLTGRVRTYPETEVIYLVWDNWPVHGHPVVQEALAAQPRVRVLWLPTYSPWLNPVEKCWRYVRQRVVHTHPWSDDFREFRYRVREVLAELMNGPPELLRYVGLSS